MDHSTNLYGVETLAYPDQSDYIWTMDIFIDTQIVLKYPTTYNNKRLHYFYSRKIVHQPRRFSASNHPTLIC